MKPDYWDKAIDEAIEDATKRALAELPTWRSGPLGSLSHPPMRPLSPGDVIVFSDGTRKVVKRKSWHRVLYEKVRGRW